MNISVFNNTNLLLREANTREICGNIIHIYKIVHVIDIDMYIQSLYLNIYTFAIYFSLPLVKIYNPDNITILITVF